jgi:hypothetical protein
MGQFKAEASDTGRYVDVLARTVTSSKTSLLELDDAMKYI